MLQTPNVAKSDDSLTDNLNKIEDLKITDKMNNEPIDIKINASDLVDITKVDFEISAENVEKDGKPIDTDNDAEYDDEDLEFDEEEEEEESQENVTDVNNNTSGEIENKLAAIISENVEIKAQSAEIRTENVEQQIVEISKNKSEELLKNNSKETQNVEISKDNKISEELLKNNTEETQNVEISQSNKITEELLKNNTENAVKSVENRDEKLNTVPSEPPLVHGPSSFQKELNSDPTQVPNSENIETTTKTLLTESTTPEFYEITPNDPDISNVQNIKNYPTPDYQKIDEVVTLYEKILEIPKTEQNIVDLMKQVPEAPKIENLAPDNSITPEFIDIPDFSSQQTTETFVNINTNELTDNAHKIEEINANFENPTSLSITHFEPTVTEKPEPEVEVTPEVANANVLNYEVTDDYSIFAKLYSLFGFSTEEEVVKEVVEELITEDITYNMWGADNQQISVNKYSSSREILTSPAGEIIFIFGLLVTF